MVGEDGEEAAWELAMHADTAQQERLVWLPLIEAAATSNDVPAEHAEYLRLRAEAVAVLVQDGIAPAHVEK